MVLKGRPTAGHLKRNVTERRKLYTKVQPRKITPGSDTKEIPIDQKLCRIKWPLKMKSLVFWLLGAR